MLHTANEIRSASLDRAKQMIRHNLQTSDAWLVRGLLAIYKRQTSDEQVSESTRHLNDVGFNRLDAGILTSLAKQVERWNNATPDARRFDKPLSDKQMWLARRKMLKYAGQLARIAKAASHSPAPTGAG